MTENLLVNGGFEGGGERFPEGSGISGLMPGGWTLDSYSRPGDPILADAEWSEPEIIPIQFHAQFPEWWLIYGATGVVENGDTLIPAGVGRWALKVFKGFAPTSADFSQSVVAPAGHYRFTCPIFPDHKLKGGERPSPASSDDWYLASEVRVGLSDDNATIDSVWLSALEVPIGRYTLLVVELQHGGGALRVGFGMRGRWGVENNCWFIDSCVLERIDVPAPDPEPVPVPDPVPAPVQTPDPRVFVVFGGAVRADGEMGQLELQEKIMRAVESVLE